MKRFVFVLPLALALSGCGREEFHDDFVKESYIHQYGVTISKSEWESRGSSGAVISTDKTGITSTKNFKHGVLEGESTFSFPHTDVIARREFYNGGQIVKLTENFRNGMPKIEREALGDGRSVVTTWYETGIPASVEHLDNGQLIKGEYYNIQHELQSKVDGGEGQRHRFDAFGALIAMDTFSEGQRTASIEYHPNGAPKAITPYANGKISGQRKTFFPGGEPKAIEQWIEGQQAGITITFQNGEKQSEVPYQNSRKHGVEKRFRDNDLVAEEVTWVHGKRHGPTRIYVGSSRKTDWYFQDRLVTKAAYQELNGRTTHSRTAIR